jgi:predicted CXXCH cytochrome family protein
MKSEKRKSGAASRPAAVCCLAAVAIVGLTQMASAFAGAALGSGAETAAGTCAYSLELKNSVSAQRLYLTKVDAALNRSFAATNAVEDMYGNIQPASYTPDDEAEPPSRSGRQAYSFGSVLSKPAAKFVGMDAMSAECVSCHDGVAATQVTVDLRDRPSDRTSMVNSPNNDHPIGMTYNSYVAAGRGYKPLLGNTKMLFVDGKVGCLSCHNPLNQEKGHLVMSDRNSSLCLTCHNK